MQISTYYLVLQSSAVPVSRRVQRYLNRILPLHAMVHMIDKLCRCYPTAAQCSSSCCTKRGKRSRCTYSNKHPGALPAMGKLRQSEAERTGVKTAAGQLVTGRRMELDLLAVRTHQRVLCSA